MDTLLIVYGLIIYFGILFIISFTRTKEIGLQEYVANKSRTNFLLVLFSLLGTIVGGGMFFAVSQMGYEAGTVGYIIGIGYFVGFCMLGALVPKIRKLFKTKKTMTLIDLIADKYAGYSWKKIQVYHLFAFINFILFLFMLAAQFVVLANFVRFFSEMPSFHSILITAFFITFLNVFFYTYVGGLRKDIITDFFQFIVIGICAGVIVTKVFNYAAITSIKNLSSVLPLSFFTGTGYGIIFMIGSLIFLPATFLVRFDFWQRIVTAKSEKQASWAFFVAAPLCLFFYMLFTNVGMYGKVLHFSSAEKFIGIKILSLLFSGQLYTFILLGILAAIMSSADTFLNVASINIAKLWPIRNNQKEIEGEEKEKMTLLSIKRFVIVTSISSLIIAFFIPNIVDLFVGSFSSILILAPATISVIFLKKPNAKAAFHSIFWGFLTFLCLFLIMPNMRKTAFAPGVLISICLFIILSKLENKHENPK